MQVNEVRFIDAMMKNLYAILDVGPDDDAETLKLAFRKAVKKCHPDLNLDDPDAAARFRELVRAKAILCNPDLRAAYDRILFESEQLRAASRWTASSGILSEAIGMAFLAFLLAGAYTTFSYMTAKPASEKKASIVVSVRQPANVTALPVLPSVATPNPQLRSEGGQSDGTHSPSQIAPGSSLESAASSVEVVAGRASALAEFLHEQGIASYRNGDMPSAITNFDLAIRLDPDLTSAYIDRSIAYYRAHEFSRAFADVGQAMRIESSRPNVPPSGRGGNR